MSITLADTTTTLTLNPDLFWSDEDYSPVQQEMEPTITGAIVVQVGKLLAGAPITLQPEDDSSGWMSRAVVEQLRNWAAVPDKELTLTLRGVSRTVVFRHQDKGVEFTPVAHRRDVDTADRYLCTIRLMEI